jgi:hypothetical protein
MGFLYIRNSDSFHAPLTGLKAGEKGEKVKRRRGGKANNPDGFINRYVS